MDAKTMLNNCFYCHFVLFGLFLEIKALKIKQKNPFPWISLIFICVMLKIVTNSVKKRGKADVVVPLEVLQTLHLAAWEGQG